MIYLSLSRLLILPKLKSHSALLAPTGWQATGSTYTKESSSTATKEASNLPATSGPDHSSQYHNPTPHLGLWSGHHPQLDSAPFFLSRPRTVPCPIQLRGQCSHADSHHLTFQFWLHPFLYPLQMHPCPPELTPNAAACFLICQLEQAILFSISFQWSSQIRHKLIIGNFSSPCTCPYSASAPTFDRI